MNNTISGETTPKNIDTSQLPEEVRNEIVDLFHTEDFTTYVIVKIGEKNDTIKVRSDEMKQFVTGTAYKNAGELIKKDRVQSIIDGLDAFARFSGDKKSVYVRVGPVSNGIEIDLNNENGECILVKPDGWEITKPTNYFYRPRAMKNLPKPKKGGTLELFEKHFNTNTDDELKLLVSVMCYYFRPQGPYPIVAFKGPEGSCKSTCTRKLKRLVDPSLTEDRSPPESERDLFISAKYDHVVCQDNLSNIRAKFSDALCRLATGGTYGRKKNYADDEEHIIKQCNPIVMNGITDLAKLPDLISRSIMIDLVPPEKSKDEETLWQEFDKDKPYMLGYLLDGVQSALKNYASVNLDSQIRLSDFAKWGTAAEISWQWEPMTFYTILEDNQSKSIVNALSTDVIANAIKRLLSNTSEWRGKAEELLEILSSNAGYEERSKSWPTTAHHLASRLNRLERSLPKIGIEYVSHKNTGLGNRDNKILILRKLGNFEDRQLETVKKEEAVPNRVADIPDDFFDNMVDGRSKTTGNWDDPSMFDD
tara:strand:+ start:26124 stop:27725 length:1602 start_codon:yes stop_codon:yes gene_type:complete